MKNRISFLLILCFLSMIFCVDEGSKSLDILSSINISVFSNKDVYKLNENIDIYVKVHNKSNQSIKLEWPSSCQSSYFIDSYHRIYGCYPAFTSLEIPPDSSHIWSHTHRSSDLELHAGTYRIIGEIIGYGTSDALTIVIE